MSIKVLFSSINRMGRTVPVQRSIPSLSALYHSNASLFKRRSSNDDDDDEKYLEEMKSRRVKEDKIELKYYSGGLIDPTPMAPRGGVDDLDDETLVDKSSGPTTIAQAMHFESIDTRNVQIDTSKEFVFELDHKEKREPIPQRTTRYREEKIDEHGRAYGTGRRKTSVAQVWIKPGCGEVRVNNLPVMEYFPVGERHHALYPFLVARVGGLFDVNIQVHGGGKMGQAGAARLGLSRALEAFCPEIKPVLKSAGLMTRDSRVVERKKIGKHKARRGFQWVKR